MILLKFFAAANCSSRGHWRNILKVGENEPDSLDCDDPVLRFQMRCDYWGSVKILFNHFLVEHDSPRWQKRVTKCPFKSQFHHIQYRSIQSVPLSDLQHPTPTAAPPCPAPSFSQHKSPTLLSLIGQQKWSNGTQTRLSFFLCYRLVFILASLSIWHCSI